MPESITIKNIELLLDLLDKASDESPDNTLIDVCIYIIEDMRCKIRNNKDVETPIKLYKEIDRTYTQRHRQKLVRTEISLKLNEIICKLRKHFKNNLVDFNEITIWIEENISLSCRDKEKVCYGLKIRWLNSIYKKLWAEVKANKIQQVRTSDRNTYRFSPN
jgi:hypothetical protein